MTKVYRVYMNWNQKSIHNSPCVDLTNVADVRTIVHTLNKMGSKPHVSIIKAGK